MPEISSLTVPRAVPISLAELGEKSTPEWDLPLKKATVLPENDSLEMGFFNSCHSASSQEDGMGLSQIQDSHFVYFYNGEKEARKKGDELWERVSAMYAVTEDHSKRFRTIWGKMIERHKCEGKRKCKGKRELWNLQSSVNYGDIKASSRCRKGKAHML
jgi:hypothetical protein